MATEIRFVVTVNDQTTATQAHEAFSRVALGLALEGIPVDVYLGPPDESEPDTDDEGNDDA